MVFPAWQPLAIPSLRDTKESRSEYQYLLSELNNVKLVFEELECFKCTADRELLDKGSKFDQPLGARFVAGVLKGSQRKLRWAFFVKIVVPTWRGQIAVMIATIQLLLQMHTSLPTQEQAVVLMGTSKDIKAISGLFRDGQDWVSVEVLE
ncbi:hypothetical protein N7G274_002781 [Stereocaulon virgatum]|uniref:Uncharacterized protein n=1 Tax=Stereocaulon virgatum TaxID=373712 RepID=A0ABR4AJG8_9LECA